MAKIKSLYASKIKLPGGVMLSPGKTVEVPNWDKMKSNNVIKAWLRAGVIKVMSGADEKADDAKAAAEEKAAREEAAEKAAKEKAEADEAAEAAKEAAETAAREKAEADEAEKAEKDHYIRQLAEYDVDMDHGSSVAELKQALEDAEDAFLNEDE